MIKYNPLKVTIIILIMASFAKAEDVVLSSIGNENIGVDEAVLAASKGGYTICDENSAERAIQDAEDFLLLVGEAQREGFFHDPEIVQLVRSMAVQKMIARKVASVPSVSLDEKAEREWYQNNIKEFTRPAVCRGRVLTISKDVANWKERFNNVSSILATNATPKFSDVVCNWSTDASERANGGQTDWICEEKINRRYSPEIVAAFFSLEQNGKIYGPIETDRAVFWISRLELRSGNVTPFEIVRSSIARRIEQQARRKAYFDLIKELRDDAKINRDANAVDNLIKATSGEGLPPAGPGPSVK